MSNQIAIITPVIRTIRGRKVILDSDLARIYGVPTKRLNEQVKRNGKRFPSDFLFQLTSAEAFRKQPVANCDRFTEASRPASFALRIHGKWRGHG
ncbi:MAG: ORF6N domain-containing protein, partial [Limisphaerales bacterium]